MFKVGTIVNSIKTVATVEKDGNSWHLVNYRKCRVSAKIKKLFKNTQKPEKAALIEFSIFENEA